MTLNIIGLKSLEGLISKIYVVGRGQNIKLQSGKKGKKKKRWPITSKEARPLL